jgi:hypothetical protein
MSKLSARTHRHTIDSRLSAPSGENAMPSTPVRSGAGLNQKLSHGAYVERYVDERDAAVDALRWLIFTGRISRQEFSSIAMFPTHMAMTGLLSCARLPAHDERLDHPRRRVQPPEALRHLLDELVAEVARSRVITAAAPAWSMPMPLDLELRRER